MPPISLESASIALFVVLVWVVVIYGFAIVFPRMLEFLERF